IGNQQDCMALGIFGSDVVQPCLPALDLDQPQSGAGKTRSRKKWREIATVARASKTGSSMRCMNSVYWPLAWGYGAGRRGGEVHASPSPFERCAVLCEIAKWAFIQLGANAKKRKAQTRSYGCCPARPRYLHCTDDLPRLHCQMFNDVQFN